MRNHQRRFSLSLALILTFLAFSGEKVSHSFAFSAAGELRRKEMEHFSPFPSAHAFQQPGAPEGQEKPKPETEAKPASGQEKAASDQGPVAITERRKQVERARPREVGSDEFGSFGFPAINNQGDVAFIGRFPSSASPQGFGQGIFVKAADGSWKVIRDGEKAVNLTDPLIGFSNPLVASNGDLIFIANYGLTTPLQNVSDQTGAPAATPAATASSYGIFTRTAAGLKNVLRAGMEVPNMPSHFTGFSGASLNSKGVIAFIGTYVDPDGRGLFLLEGDKLQLVVRSGQKTAPGETTVFSEHYYPSAINERGEVAWFSRISGGGGIFVRRPNGKVEAIALQNTPSPIAGGNYIGFGQITPSINNKGEVAFVGFYDGPEAGRALFFKGEGKVEVIAKSGDHIPGTTYNFTSFNSPVSNSQGDIAFIGFYGGRMRGIFLKTAKGIEPVALAEQKVPGAASQDELFNNFTPPALNDRGEVVFYAQLKNATVGLFIKDASGLRALVKRGDKLPQKK
jgi:hypothetical protein